MNRYGNVPVSDETIKGMTLNINDIAFFKRFFDLQGESLEIEFNSIKQSLAFNREAMLSVMEKLKEIKAEIMELKGEVDSLRERVLKLSIDVDCHDTDIKMIKKELFNIKTNK